MISSVEYHPRYLSVVDCQIGSLLEVSKFSSKVKVRGFSRIYFPRLQTVWEMCDVIFLIKMCMRRKRCIKDGCIICKGCYDVCLTVSGKVGMWLVNIRVFYELVLVLYERRESIDSLRTPAPTVYCTKVFIHKKKILDERKERRCMPCGWSDFFLFNCLLHKRDQIFSWHFF